MRHLISIGFVLAVGLGACTERPTEKEDADVRAACDERCAHLTECGLDNGADGDLEECSDICLTRDPWVWTDCRTVSLELYACSAALTCEELRAKEDDSPPVPIEDLPCYEESWAYGMCASNRNGD